MSRVTAAISCLRAGNRCVLFQAEWSRSRTLQCLFFLTTEAPTHTSLTHLSLNTTLNTHVPPPPHLFWIACNDPYLCIVVNSRSSGIGDNLLLVLLKSTKFHLNSGLTTDSHMCKPWNLDLLWLENSKDVTEHHNNVSVLYTEGWVCDVALIEYTLGSGETQEGLGIWKGEHKGPMGEKGS